MVAAPVHAREEERLRILAECEILDTPAEDLFDRIAGIAAQICECPISLINLIDRERQWFKAAVGTDLRSTPRDVSFCAHTILRGEPLIVDDATTDEQFKDNPLVIDGPRVRFYAGVPLHVGPLALGTLCVIDVMRRTLSTAQRDALIALAHDVEAQLELRRALHRTERLGEDRRQLASMIVHDMRSPLTVALSGAQFLAADPRLPDPSRRVVAQMIIAARRLERMVHDLLDVSRSDSGRLEPITETTSLEPLADQIAASLRTLASEHRLVFASTLRYGDEAIVDGDLVRRIVENLAENAFKYAPDHSEVTVDMSLVAGPRLRIVVGDHGPGIPPELRERVFDASFRLARDAHVDARMSYGLGLRFCRAATEAMGGRIWVEDNPPNGARFIAELPVA